MKLAEALIERADLKSKIEMLRARLVNNCRTQEGVEPSENPKDLMIELDEKLERMEYLVIHINKTNAVTTLPSGETIADLIAKKDILNKKIGVLSSLVDVAGSLVSRATRSEIKVLSTVNVKELQKKVDLCSKELRLLDTKLQECNWTTELI